ncbi:S9 family peptidase [Shewanella marinintestina]|uniref:alpha/beta hydrolase family protein n=1 Tax=Shewanella marinintestina TaxID=190305 RepID=UPI00200BBA31|nr:S9 family peptidase [Shewanella marinintestina]MCL1147410.1 S9 family peptidase [Shewanella marinintestina]
MRIISAIVSAAILSSSFLVQASSIEQAELFSRSAEFTAVKISPKGDYLSGISIDKESDKRALIILDLETMKPSYIVNFKGKGEVGSYYWVNDERVVLQKSYKQARIETSAYYGEMLAVNADGSKPKYIFGYKGSGGGTSSGNIKKSSSIQATSYMLDTLPEEEDDILVMAYPWTGTNHAITQVYKVDVYSGKRKKLTSSPVQNANFLVDHDQNVRLSFSQDEKQNDLLYYFDEDKNKWIDADSLRGDLTEFRPLSFTKDDKSIYAIGAKGVETHAIYKINLKTKVQEKVIQHPVVDPSQLWIDDQTKVLYAVEFENGFPEYQFIDDKNSKAKALNQLMVAIPDHRIRIISETNDGNTMIVLAMNDKNPGDYYLFDSKKMKLKYLFAEKSWLNPDKMAEVKPIEFTSRDGKQLHGYITLPNGIEHKNMPLVVNPHGGPHGPRDNWVFNTENQLLAQHGIAVLQVNFRGSGGYGPSFEQDGYRKWGAEIQYDIIDATQFAIDQGWANKDKICISGASFGGYSALMAPTIAPDMYKCAVGTVGVYDLEELHDSGDIPRSYSGGAFLNEVLGNDTASLRAMSPTHNVHKLKASVLLLHGEEDERAPMEQFDAMEKALKKANYPYEKKIWDKSGHGFYTPESRELYYDTMVSFIKKNLEL